MARGSIKSVTVDPNVRCLRVYPVKGTNRSVEELKTVGMKLSRNQAIHFATVLLAAAHKWDEMEITAYRLKKRKSDGTYQITLTSFLR